ncbi:MAG: hypothetical protein R3D68_12005 [Hyphomicrobiaceae bacterium]
MLERIEYLARVSVSRACGFAGLAIVTFFVGMSGDMPAAFKSAGFLALLACLVLLLKAHQAPRRPYKSTELWLMLRPEERPEAAIAQQIIGTVLRETFLHFALHAAAVAAALLGIAVLYATAGY